MIYVSLFPLWDDSGVMWAHMGTVYFQGLRLEPKADKISVNRWMVQDGWMVGRLVGRSLATE